jgi:hypothetical protein
MACEKQLKDKKIRKTRESLLLINNNANLMDKNK